MPKTLTDLYLVDAFTGQSFEGREMKVIKITSNSSTGNKSAVFVEGGAHAREWISPVFVNNLIYKVYRLTL